MARGGRYPRRVLLPVLAHGGDPDPVAVAARHLRASLCQFLRRGRHRLCADRKFAFHRPDPALRPDPRRRAAGPASRLRARLRHDRGDRHRQRHLYLAAHTQRAVAEMKRNSLWSWIVLVLAVLYFALPLIGTFEFSLKMRRGVYSFDAYRVVLNDPRFQSTFLYSVTMALCTIVLGIVIVVPTAYWVRLKLPRWRPIIEFITLLPLVIPPIVVVFGYIRLYNTSSWLPLTGSAW